MFQAKLGHGEPPSSLCQKIRFADVGWTDVSVTTAVAARILDSYGFHSDRKMLSVPVTFRALKDGDVDVFLGNWMPSMAADIKPYAESGDIETIQTILEGARYTLAVPTYVAQAGVQSFHDLARFRDKFAGKIYGIESGNDGNQIIERLIKSPAFKLDTWKLIESSEQAMLGEVMRAVEAKEWIVFLAWSPHPMNKKINLQYLTDGDRFFGPNFGGARVFINTRRGLTRDCPSVGMFLKNIKFNVDEVNELMEMVMEGASPDGAAAKWIAAHRTRVEEWTHPLANSEMGKVQAALFKVDEDQDPKLGGSGRLGSLLQQGTLKVINVLNQSTRGSAQWTNTHLQTITQSINSVPPWAILCGLSLIAWILRRQWQTVIFTQGATCLVWGLGYWKETWETLTLVLVASFLALSLGIPMGIVACKWKIFYRWMRPFLDIMQTLPTFVYLIPTLMLFGLGMTSGLVATIVFVLPVSIRLTYLGFSSVPADLKELGKAFGAGFWQTLWKIEIPHAWPTIRAAVSQSLMLALSMVVVAALVGAEGLGRPVVQALNTVDLAKGIEAGLAIVAIAMTLDRLVQTSESTPKKSKV